MCVSPSLCRQLWCVPSESSGNSTSGGNTQVCSVRYFVTVLMVLPFASLFVPMFGLVTLANQTPPGLRQVRIRG